MGELDNILLELREEMINLLENNKITKKELKAYLDSFIDNELSIY